MGGQHGCPVAAHFAVRWPSIVGQPFYVHLAPRSASTPDHLADHVRPPSPSIVAPRLGPPPSTMAGPVRPTLAVRGCHFLDHVHLHCAVRWPSKLRQPIGTPQAFWPSTSCVVGDQFRPRFGSPFGDHFAAWPSTLQPSLGDHMAHHPCIVPRLPFLLTQAGTKTECIGAPPARARPRCSHDLHPCIMRLGWRRVFTPASWTHVYVATQKKPPPQRGEGCCSDCPKP